MIFREVWDAKRKIRLGICRSLQRHEGSGVRYTRQTFPVIQHVEPGTSPVSIVDHLELVRGMVLVQVIPSSVLEDRTQCRALALSIMSEFPETDSVEEDIANMTVVWVREVAHIDVSPALNEQQLDALLDRLEEFLPDFDPDPFEDIKTAHGIVDPINPVQLVAETDADLLRLKVAEEQVRMDAPRRAINLLET